MTRQCSRSRKGAKPPDRTSWKSWIHKGTTVFIVHTHWTDAWLHQEYNRQEWCRHWWKGIFCRKSKLTVRWRIWCWAAILILFYSPEYKYKYLVGTSDDKWEIAVVMNQKDENTDVPLVGEVAEKNQENWEAMMQAILEEISFRANEDVPKEATEVLSELANVKYFHFKCWVWYLRR